MANQKIDVFAMVDEYAAANDVDPSEVFKNHPATEDVKTEAAKVEEKKEIPEETPAPQPEAKKPKKEAWVPDASLLEGMEEFSQQPVVYDKKDLETKDDGSLKNIADDNAMQDAIETMDELHRTHANIEAAKKRHGIINLQIPPGPYHVSITAAAGDTNYKRAQEGLDEIFNEIKTTFPEMILEWAPGFGPNQQKAPEVVPKDNLAGDKIINLPNQEGVNPEATGEESQATFTAEPSGDDVKVIIDKKDLPQISWTPEEMEKIRKARTVELNIVENASLQFGEIEEAPSNLVDKVLEPYQRKVNSVTAALPGSRYRATFIGLSYPEVMDLSNSEKMNNIDGEWKKWSIAFEHIRNPSIGPWEEYAWYKDPTTNKKVRIGYNENPPAELGIEDDDIHRVSKFDDFLMKTSYVDLEFMLWKILCATALDKEIVSIQCRSHLASGKVCDHSYDWVYAPRDLLNMESINPAVLEEMKKTGEVEDKNEIIANYNSSPVHGKDTVRLASSGLNLCIGHASGYDYLNDIYPTIEGIDDETRDPSIITTSMAYATLIAIKGILVPKPDGTGTYKITGTANVANAIKKMDSVDFQTIGEIVKMMTEPYQFEYSLRDLVCPQCHSRSSIRIPNLERLLFTVARSLESVQVKLTRT